MQSNRGAKWAPKGETGVPVSPFGFYRFLQEPRR
jgi:hypothetical protein